MRRRPAVVLGASGLVGQRMQQRLVNHPWFELTAIGGSAASAGKSLEEIPWRLEQERPPLPQVQVLEVLGESFVEELQALGIEVAFSCLPSDVANQIEPVLVNCGIAVFSNASSFRRELGIPLVIPDINPEHMSEFNSSKGMHACATNCTLVPMAVPIAALRQWDVTKVSMRSEQALSGAGWKLLEDEDARNGYPNPEIPGEAEKVVQEFLHVMGEGGEDGVVPATIEVDVKCQRIGRRDGHQVFVEVEFKQPITQQEIILALKNHDWSQQLKLCPSTPLRPIHLVDEIDVDNHLWSDGIQFSSRPLPSQSLKTGMAVVVGNVQVKGQHNLVFSAYSHNTIRGASGGTLLLAEQALIEDRIPER